MAWNLARAWRPVGAAALAVLTATRGYAIDGSVADSIDLISCDQPYGAVDCGDGCDPCCGDPACGDSCCSGGGLLGGLIKPSDHCYDDFISPMTNPTYFEDPRNLTEVRGIFIQHKVPQTAAGGDIQLYAAQLRARVSDRVSIIATKDGYAVSSNPLIADGWADVALGLKYLVYADPETQRLLSAGATYTAPWGSPRTLQAQGDGDFHLFTTGGARMLDYGHVIAATGLRIPADHNTGSQLAYVSTHLDYQIFRKWTPSRSSTSITGRAPARAVSPASRAATCSTSVRPASRATTS